MLKMPSLVSCCFFLSSMLFAQTDPAAEGHGRSLWVGGEISTFNPDWGCVSASPFTCWNHQLLGFVPVVDANDLLRHKIGVEGEARIMRWHGPEGYADSSYLVGPRFGLFRLKEWYFSGKVGLGNAEISVHDAGNGNHFAIAPGFIAEFKLRPRLAVRAEYEYQIIPGFKGTPTNTTSGCCGLTPNGFSLGLSYAVLR